MDIRNFFAKKSDKQSQPPDPGTSEEGGSMAMRLDPPECMVDSSDDSDTSLTDVQNSSTSTQEVGCDEQGDSCASNREMQDEAQTVPTKKKKYYCEFTPKLSKSYPVLKKSARGKHYIYCTVCNSDFDIKHGGINDCKRHVDGVKHRKLSEARESSQKMVSFLTSSQDENAVINAEVLFTGFLIEHNIPISASDHVGKLMRAMMPNSSEVAVQKYGCGRTKTSAIINHALAPHCTKPVIEALKSLPFTLALDGGNESEEKLFPILVSYFDMDGKVKPKLLDLVVCNIATSINIVNAVDEVFQKEGIPWKNCIGLCLDNASVNMGRHRSVKTLIQQKSPSVFTEGCPCHLVHLAASKANNELSFDADAFLHKLTTYFKFSAKRIQGLKDMSEFVDIEYAKILQHGATRWLSLHSCLERVLKMFPALKSFFQSEDCEKNARSKVLCEILEDPTTELYVLFLHAVLCTFNETNTVLQCRSPLIHKLQECLMDLYKKLLLKLVKPTTIKAAHTVEGLLGIDFCDPEMQMGDRELFIGFTTSNYVRTCSSLEPRAVAKIFREVRNFYCSALTYMKNKCPLNDDVIKAMKVFDYKNRVAAQFGDIEVLAERFPQVVDHTMMQKVHEEFSEYRIYDLPESSLQRCTEEGIERVDCIWHELSMVTHPATGNKKFALLSSMAKSLLVLPHSNAEIERVFSMVRKVKTELRGKLATEGTLKSLLQCKINLFTDLSCHQFKPSKELLSKAKSAGYELRKTYQHDA